MLELVLTQSLESFHVVPLGGIHSCCFLLRMGFDGIFSDLVFLKCLFSLSMFIFMLTLIFHLRNFPLRQLRVRNVGFMTAITQVPNLVFKTRVRNESIG